MAWNKLCWKKDEGSMGFRDFLNFICMRNISHERGVGFIDSIYVSLRLFVVFYTMVVFYCLFSVRHELWFYLQLSFEIDSFFFYYKFSEFIDFVVHSTCSTESGVEIKDFVGGSYIFWGKNKTLLHEIDTSDWHGPRMTSHPLLLV